MREIRILHTADLHLDCLLGGLPYERRVERRAEIFAGLRRVVQLAGDHRVDALLVVGDLFDLDCLSRETVAQVSALFRSAGLPILLVPGNHDPGEDPRSPYREDVFPPNCHVFGGDEFTAFSPVEGLTVHGLPFLAAARRRRQLRDFARRFPPTPGEGFRVVAHHGAYSGFTLPEGDYAPVLPQDLVDTQAHYVALGHHHNWRDVTPRGGPPACYPGSPVRLDWSNLPERKALLVRFKPGAPAAEVEPLVLEDRPYLEIEFNPATAPLEDLIAELEAVADEQAMVRVVLEGTVPGDGLVHPDRLEAAYRGRFFHLKVEDRTRPAPSDRPQSTITGLFLARLAQRLEGLPEDAPDREALNLATKYGLAALRGEDLR
ncbi:MAG: DNA repair exonuclease [bacterium]|nr:DNA repair exonuclease [bacterium]